MRFFFFFFSLVLSLYSATGHTQNVQPNSFLSNKGFTASRTLLGSGTPLVVPNFSLSMFRVVFPAGASVPGEIHSGMQVVTILSGEMRVKILGGEAQVKHIQSDGSLGTIEILKPGPEEIILGTGDVFIEPETLVLAARNVSKEPAIILTSSLIPNHLSQSIPITEPVEIKK